MTERKPMTPRISLMLIEAMQVEPMTYDDLANISGVQRPVIARFIKSAREDKLVRISGWKADVRGYPTVPQFRFGNTPDTPRPTPKTAAQRMAATRAARKGLV